MSSTTHLPCSKEEQLDTVLSSPDKFEALDEEEQDTAIRFQLQSQKSLTLKVPGLLGTMSESIVDHSDLKRPEEFQDVHEPLEAALDSEGMFLRTRNPQISANNQTAGTRPVTTPRLKLERKYLSEWKRQAMEEDCKFIFQNIRPICFVPPVSFDFSKHEILLRRLKLWDFVHLEFDMDVRHDILAMLIVNYNSKKNISYVNGKRINLSRLHLAHALMLPLKKERAGADMDGLPEGFAAFFDDVLPSFVLLQGDVWMLPTEVMEMVTMIKCGHPEKVAALMWFMVEKELLQGKDLVHCYYASHLMRLIKFQKKTILEDLLDTIPFPSKEEENVQKVNVLINEAVKKDNDVVKVEEKAIDTEKGKEGDEDRDRDGVGGDVMMGGLDNFDVYDSQEHEQNFNLSLEKDNVVKEVDMDIGMMDFEDSKEDGTGEWCFNAKGSPNDQFLRRCHFNVQGLESDTPREEDGVEKEDSAFTHDGMMDENHAPFNSGEQGDAHPPEKLQAFKHAGKRSMEDENIGGGGSFHGIHDKKTRMNVDDEFYSCYNQTMQSMQKTLMLYEAKKQACVDLNMQTQFLSGEVQRREGFIMHLREQWCEEIEKKKMEIHMRDRELFGMCRVMEDYRKALRKTDMEFSQYRERNPQPRDEFLYVDVAGSGGMVASAIEMERQCEMELEKQGWRSEEAEEKKEEEMMRCWIVEEIKGFDRKWSQEMERYCAAVEELDGKVAGFVEDFEGVKGMGTKKKLSSGFGGMEEES